MTSIFFDPLFYFGNDPKVNKVCFPFPFFSFPPEGCCCGRLPLPPPLLDLDGVGFGPLPQAFVTGGGGGPNGL